MAIDTTEPTLQRYRSDWRALIVERPGLLGGRPTLSGTRVGVEMVLEMLGSGSSVETLLREFPTLRPELISAALLYGAACVRDRFANESADEDPDADLD